MTNLQQQLGAQQQALQQVQAVMDAQQASAAQLAVDPEPVTRRCRVFIESRAFSKLAIFDSKAASWKDWASEFENMAAAVVPSSRDSLEWAAQQKTPTFGG